MYRCRVCKIKVKGSNNEAVKFCSYECKNAYALKMLKKIQANTKKREAELDKKKTKELREKLKTLTDYENEARKVFQQWIRKRDEKLPCISCGATNPISGWDAGHYFKAELYSGLIFNEDNCWKQCKRPCNYDLHGNEANYRIGLIKRIGEERVKWLEENKDRLRKYKFTRDELKAIKEKYSQLLTVKAK